MVTSAIEQGLDEKLSNDELRVAADNINSARASLVSTMKLLEVRRQSMEGDLLEEAESLQERAKKAGDQIEQMRALLNKRKECLKVQELLEQAKERVEQAEKALAQASEASLPFRAAALGELPEANALEAIRASDAAVIATEAAVSQANFMFKALKSKDAVSVEELEALRTRTEKADARVKMFKKETARRRAGVLLRETSDKVIEAEEQVHTLVEVAHVFAPENLAAAAQKLLEGTTDTLQTECARATVAAEDAIAACTSARASLCKKQHEVAVASAKDPSLVAELSRIQVRLNIAHGQLMKYRKAATTGDRLIKSKEIQAAEEEKVERAESEVAKAESMATPLGEIAFGDKGISADAVAKIDLVVESAKKLVSDATKSIDDQLPGAIAPLRATLSKLLYRGKKAQDRLDSVVRYAHPL